MEENSTFHAATRSPYACGRFTLSAQIRVVFSAGVTAEVGIDGLVGNDNDDSVSAAVRLYLVDPLGLQSDERSVIVWAVPPYADVGFSQTEGGLISLVFSNPVDAAGGAFPVP